MYGTYEKFLDIYGTPMSMGEHSRFAWEADRLIDRHTTGLDNVRKLRVAFPTDEYDVECVQRCECALVYILHRFEVTEKLAASNAESTGRAVSGGVIKSVSSGSESIEYATDSESASGTAIDAAAKDTAKRAALIARTVRDYLSGAQDVNGVNLLYMGVYPYVL